MHGTCPTVKVKSANAPDGFIVINESDFDASKHERAAELPVPPAAPLLPPPPPAPTDPLADLGKDWRTRDDLRALAAAVNGGRAVENKKQAVEVIEAELAKRAAK